MKWVTVQLTNLAKSRYSTQDLFNAVRKKIKHPNLEIFYPVVEDVYGKKESAFAEYLFISYDPTVDFFNLENTDEFNQIIKETTEIVKTRGVDHNPVPRLSDDRDLEHIRQRLNFSTKLEIDDIVKVLTGPMKATYGVVLAVEDTEVLLEVTVGAEKLQLSMDSKNLRKSWSRTVKYKKALEKQDMILTTEVYETPQSQQEEKVKVSYTKRKLVKVEGTIEKIIRKGEKNTRVLVNGEPVLMANSELIERLTQQGTLKLLEEEKDV
jgi:transcription antitermination factor NusG